MKTITTKTFQAASSDPVGKFIVRLLSLAVVAGFALAGNSAFAASASWVGNSTDTQWGTNGNWSPAAFPGNTGGATNSTDVATFSAGNPTYKAPPLLAGTINLLGIQFGGTATNYTIGSTGGAVMTLTSGGNVSVASTVSNNQTINSPIVLGGAGNTTYSFINNSSSNNTLTFGGTMRGANSAGTTGLLIDGSSTGGVILDGIISNGTGRTLAITKNGTGSATLNGTNTYTGATVINAGTFILNGSTAAGSAVTINTAGTLSGTGTVNGNATLTGSGIINKASGTIAGTLGVTGGNWNGAGIVTGLVTSSSGTFNIGSGATLTANGGLNVTGGTIAAGNATSTVTGNVSYTSASSSTFQGILAGTGKTVTLNNSAATLTLSGANSFTGQLSVLSGTLSAASINNASASGVLGNSATAVILGNTGGVTGTLAYTGSSANSTKAFTMGAGGTGNFDVTQSGTTLGLSGLINGTGSLTKTGNGSLTVSGTNSYSGTTTVSAGTFFVDGNQASATGAVNIQANAKLGGIGTVGGNTTIENLATLSPGNSPGLLSFVQNLTMNGTNTKVIMEVLGTDRGVTYDAVYVGGILTYSGNLTISSGIAIANSTYNLFYANSYGGVLNSMAFAGGYYDTTPFTTSDGGATFIANTGSQLFTFTAMDGNLTVVPEPASIALLLMGTTFLLWRRKKTIVAKA